MNNWISLAVWISLMWLAGTTVFQAIYTWLYTSIPNSMGKQNKQIDANDSGDFWQQDHLPQAAVILCVRGGDDKLLECLSGLTRLVYPNFELHLAVDHAEDPHGDSIQQFAAHAKIPINVHVMSSPKSLGGLKCERLNAVIEKLAPSVDIVALVDADVVVSTDWLGRLVAPLADPSVGMVTGNRWYGLDGSTAAAVRGIWNAAAVVQMELYQVPWGGSCAFRLETYRQLKLHELWDVAFCEDVSAGAAIRKSGLRIERPRDLVLINDDPTTWTSLGNFLVRQLLCTRLYHWAWPWICLHGINGLMMSLAVLVIVVLAAATGHFGAALTVVCGFVFYLFLSWLLMLRVCDRNRNIASASKIELHVARKQPGRFMFLIAITQLFYAFCLLHAMFAHRVRWRQIDYALKQNQVRRLNYAPYKLQETE